MSRLSLAAVLLAAAGQAAAQQSPWGQCGGSGWSGPTTCQSGYTCSEQNPYYSQCIPGGGSSSGGGSDRPEGGSGTGTSSGQQSLCSNWAYWSGNGYELNNNLWGMSAASSGSQCTYLDGSSSNGVSWSTSWHWQGGENNVKSYVYSGRQIQTGRLISSISSMPTSVSWSYNTANGVRANVAYDIFTASDPNHSTNSGDYELMIWLDHLGDVRPIGGTPSVTNVNVGGTTWDLYTGAIGSQKTFSFVSANGPLTSWSGDVKAFFTYLAQRQGYPQGSQYLLTFQFGTEAFTGGPTKFTVSSWSANVN